MPWVLPRLRNSCKTVLICIYIVLHMTTSIDCHRVGALPRCMHIGPYLHVFRDMFSVFYNKATRVLWLLRKCLNRLIVLSKNGRYRKISGACIIDIHLRHVRNR